MSDVLYRYVDVRYAAPLDEWDNPCGKGSLDIQLKTYQIFKRTPKGAWIYLYSSWGNKKFVNLTSRKKFACETKEGAMESYIARKECQIRILSSQLEDAQTFLRIAKAKGVAT